MTKAVESEQREYAAGSRTRRGDHRGPQSAPLDENQKRARWVLTRRRGDRRLCRSERGTNIEKAKNVSSLMKSDERARITRWTGIDVFENAHEEYLPCAQRLHHGVSKL